MRLLNYFYACLSNFYDNQQKLSNLTTDFNINSKKGFISNDIYLLKPSRYNMHDITEASVELSPSHEIT